MALQTYFSYLLMIVKLKFIFLLRWYRNKHLSQPIHVLKYKHAHSKQICKLCKLTHEFCLNGMCSGVCTDTVYGGIP